VAERGGGTSFTKADVFVKPKKGMTTFFSYRGPDGLMDDGFTEHSGCPVLQGGGGGHEKCDNCLVYSDL